MQNWAHISRWLGVPILLYATACFAFDDGFDSLSKPQFLPDGAHIIFSYTLNGKTDIFGFDLKSQKLQQLTHATPEQATVSPALSPDGSTVAFALLDEKTDGEPGSLFLMNADGSAQKKLTAPPAGSCDLFPVWSSDGKTLYFARATLYRRTSTFGHTWDNYDLYSLKIGESKEKRITEKEYYELTPVSFIPKNDSILVHVTDVHKDSNGSLLVFDPKDGSFHLFDHQGLDELTFSSRGDILFLRQTNPGVEGEYDYDLFLMKSDGSNKRQITRNHSYNYSPCISPNEKTIIFLSNPKRDSTPHLMQVGTDGSNLHEIVIFPKSEAEKLFLELLRAAESDDIKKIELLVAKGVDVNERDREGAT